MTSQIYLVGSEIPCWINEPPDVFTERLEHALNTNPRAMLAVTNIVTHNEDEDEPYYEERTAYIRADQCAYVAPLGPRAREHLAEARGTA